MFTATLVVGATVVLMIMVSRAAVKTTAPSTPGVRPIGDAPTTKASGIADLLAAGASAEMQMSNRQAGVLVCKILEQTLQRTGQGDP